MQKHVWLTMIACLFALVLLGTGCGSDDEALNLGDNDSNVSGDTDEGAEDTPENGLEQDSVVDETLLNTCQEDGDCSKGFCWKADDTKDGICAVEPKQEASLYWENSYYDYDDRKKKGSYDPVLENDEPVDPDFSCSSAGLEDDFTEESTVNLAARVKVFGVAAPCTSLIVEIHNQNDESGEIKTSYPTSESLITPTKVTEPEDDQGQCKMTINDVPVNRWLVFKSYDEGNVDFHDTYQFNIYIDKKDVVENEDYDIEVNAISDASWKLVPATAGVTQGVRSDRSVASGTVRDCGDRLVKNATVAMSVKATKTSYFNANVSNLVPMNTLTNTNSDGTFAFIDVAPGVPEGTKVSFVALALVDGEITPINNYDFMLFPNAVTIVAMDGGQTMHFGHFEAPTSDK